MPLNESRPSDGSNEHTSSANQMKRRLPRRKYRATYRAAGTAADRQRCHKVVVALLSDLAATPTVPTPTHPPSSPLAGAPDATANEPLTHGGQRAATPQE